jgi:hypothetical protein
MRADCGVTRYVACVVFVAVGLAVSIACGEFVVVEDFDSLALGDIDDQGGWQVSGINADVVLAPGEGLNQALKVTTDSGVLHKSATIPAGDVRMLFLRFRFEGQHAYSFGMSYLFSPTEISDFGPELRMVSASNRFEIHNGHTYDLLTTLQPETWYNLWALVDNDSDDTQVWLHTRPGEGATAADQLDSGGQTVFDFRTETVSNLIKFYIKAADGGSGQDPLWFDDIYLENSGTLNLTNPVPEPHTLVCLASAAIVLLCCLRRRRT